MTYLKAKWEAFKAWFWSVVAWFKNVMMWWLLLIPAAIIGFFFWLWF
jgi:hypothetical protein